MYSCHHSGVRQCPLSRLERLPYLGGSKYIRCMLKSIGAFRFVHSTGVACISEGPIREVPLYTNYVLLMCLA